MDSSWREWRNLEDLWERFEEKGWELGPVKYLHLPPILAEFGPYRVIFRYREPLANESLFELRQAHEGKEYSAVLVWGLPTPQEAQSLLETYGEEVEVLEEDEVSGETVEAAAACEFWGGFLPPVVHSSESRHRDG